jgi:hypothetical protein
VSKADQVREIIVMIDKVLESTRLSPATRSQLELFRADLDFKLQLLSSSKPDALAA